MGANMISQRYVKKGVLCIGNGFGSFPLFVGREGSPRSTSSFRAAFVLAWLSLNLVTDCFTPLITSCLALNPAFALLPSTMNPPHLLLGTIKDPHNSNQISFAKRFPNETVSYFVGDVTLGHDLANVLRTRLHSPSWQRLSWPKAKAFLMLDVGDGSIISTLTKDGLCYFAVRVVMLSHNLCNNRLIPHLPKERPCLLLSTTKGVHDVAMAASYPIQSKNFGLQLLHFCMIVVEGSQSLPGIFFLAADYGKTKVENHQCPITLLSWWCATCPIVEQLWLHGLCTATTCSVDITYEASAHIPCLEGGKGTRGHCQGSTWTQHQLDKVEWYTKYWGIINLYECTCIWWDAGEKYNHNQLFG